MGRIVLTIFVLALLFATLLGCRREPEVTGPQLGRKAPSAGLPLYRLAVHPLHNPAKLMQAYQPLIDYQNIRLQGARLTLEASRDYANFEEKYRARRPEFLLPNVGHLRRGMIAADDISGLQELVEAQRHYSELLFAILADQEGRVLADTDNSRQGLYLLDLPREARQAVLSGTPVLADVAVPAMIGGRHVGWARVGIGQKVAGKKLAEITRSGVVYALAAILTGSVISINFLLAGN